MTKPKRCRKLTPDEKKAAWEKPQENAGAGWTSQDDRWGLDYRHDPRRAEYGEIGE